MPMDNTNSIGTSTDYVALGSAVGRRSDKFLREELKFMNDFDPSKRIEQKKKKRYVIDGQGRPQLNAHNFDGCDCLIPECPGCHFPCKRCDDERCGHECRQNRRWIYESIETEGREGQEKERKNPN